MNEDSEIFQKITKLKDRLGKIVLEGQEEYATGMLPIEVIRSFDLPRSGWVLETHPLKLFFISRNLTMTASSLDAPAATFLTVSLSSCMNTFHVFS